MTTIAGIDRNCRLIKGQVFLWKDGQDWTDLWIRTDRSQIEGVIAQGFYLGAQIICWTLVIQCAENELGMSKTEAFPANSLRAYGIFGRQGGSS